MRTRLDLYLAILGIVALVAVAPIFIVKHFNLIYVVAEGFGLAGIVGYLLIRNKPSVKQSVGDWGFPAIAAVMCYVFAVVAFVARPEQYVKPITYYIFIALSIAFACFSVLKYKKATWVVLGLAIAIGLTHIWTENMMFPSLLGLDVWEHKYITENVFSVPSILDFGGGYSLMHVFLRGTMDVTGLSYKISSLLFWGSLQTAGTIVLVYLIGREWFSKEVGLIGALMVSCANWVIFFGEWVIPNGMGVTFSLLVAYLFIKAYKSNKLWIASLSVIVIPVALLTHLIASIWVVGTILCMSLLFVKNKKMYALSLAAVAVLGFGLWYWFSGVGIASRSFRGGTDAVGSAPTLEFSYLKGLSWEMVLNTAGMFSYFGVGIIGLLMMVNHGLGRIWAVLTVGVLLIGIIPPLFGKSLIEHRWWYFADVLITIPLALSLSSILNMKNGAIAVPCVGAVVFLSTIGLPSNTTNRSLSHNQVVRYALTQGELDALPVAQSYRPQLLGSDPLFLLASQRPFVSVSDNILTDNFTGCKADVLVLRDSLCKEPFGYGSGAIYNLKNDPIPFAESQGYTDVWHNEAAHVLVRQ